MSGIRLEFREIRAESAVIRSKTAHAVVILWGGRRDI